MPLIGESWYEHWYKLSVSGVSRPCVCNQF